MPPVDFAAAVGIAAAVLGLASFLYANPLAFKLQLGLGSILWGVHFGLLGSMSAMLTQFAIGLRTWCTISRHAERHRALLLVASSAVFAALAWSAWEGWVSLLPLAAAINSTAAFLRDSNRGMRVQLLGSSALWIATGTYWHSWPMVLTEFIVVCANLRTIHRLGQPTAPAPR